MEEDFPARLEAVFPDRASADAAARALCQQFEFDEEQLSIVCTDQRGGKVHRNRYAFKASGRREQKRQLTATLVAFAVVGIGLGLLQVSGISKLSPGLTTGILAGLIIAAVLISVIGLLSWRPPRVETRSRLQEGETALVIHVHDVSEQYALRDALLKTGARVEGAASASVS